MKIINVEDGKKKAYVQLNDVMMMMQLDSLIPAEVMDKIFSKVFIVTDENRFEFAEALLDQKNEIENINNYSLDDNQIQIHKKRVKACFCNDIEQRGYRGIRISQMLWGSYFVNIRLLEVGILQFENAGNGIIKIHIPAQTKLFIEEVKNSIFNSKEVIEKYFKLKIKAEISRARIISAFSVAKIIRICYNTM